MNIPMVDLKSQYQALKPEIDAALLDVLAETRFILGPNVDAFERELTAGIFASSLQMVDKLHLQQSVNKLVAISDAVEDAADRLQWVSVKSVI